MLRIVPHTVPRVGRSYEHFPDGFEVHLLLGWGDKCVSWSGLIAQGGDRVGLRVQVLELRGLGFVVEGCFGRVGPDSLSPLQARMSVSPTSL